MLNKNSIKLCKKNATVRITEAWADEIFQECAFIQSEPTTVALWLEPIKVLSVIGQRTKKHS